MHISEDVLEKLICNKCHQYLSVKPIKVYPSKQVKCGRCSKENDGGVISTNFALIAEMFDFPCVNRFEGCDIYLPYSDIELHEKQCIAKSFECPKCAFKGSAYFLLKHFQMDHPNFVICNETIAIKIQESRLNDYCLQTIEGPNNTSMLAVIMYAYDNETKCLTLEAQYCSPKTQNLLHSLKLYSYKNELQWMSKNHTCCQWKTYDSNPISVSINADDYPDNIVICKVSVQTEQCVYLKSSNPTIDDNVAGQIHTNSYHSVDAKETVLALLNALEERNREAQKLAEENKEITAKLASWDLEKTSVAKLSDLEREMNQIKQDLSHKNHQRSRVQGIVQASVQANTQSIPGPSRLTFGAIPDNSNLIVTIDEKARQGFIVINEEIVVKFTNISQIGMKSYNSPQYNFYNRIWQIFAEKSRSGKTLGLGLELIKPRKPCSVYATFTLLSSFASCSITESFDEWYIFDNQDESFKIDFIKWNELMNFNKGFVSCVDTITVVAKLCFTTKGAGKRM